jgi:AraC family transcriptional regulator
MGFHRVQAESSTPGGVRYRTCVFGPHDATPPHEHEAPFFCIVLDGMSEQHSGAEERVRARGQVFFYPARERQSERFGRDGGRIFVVEVPETDARLPRVSRELLGPAALLARRVRLADDDLAVEDFTFGIIGSLSCERIDARWVPIARDFLHAQFAEKLTLARIASAAGVHPVHLSRAFPQRFGTTLGD